MRSLRTSVEPLPEWLDPARLLGTDDYERTPLEPGRVRVTFALPPEEAADLAARLRGIGIDGRALSVRTQPALSRDEVRAGRLRDARARRETTPGFTRANTRVSGEGRYSLTPEVLALALGQRAAGRSVVDACCGSGGNAIGFARAGSQVTAYELDAARLDEARHNAAVYGVSDRIRFIHGDVLRGALPDGALLFVDPPWGEHYDKRSCGRADFPLLDALLDRPFGGAERWLKLPSSFAIESVPGAQASPWYGEMPGDHRRIKFLLLQCPC